MKLKTAHRLLTRLGVLSVALGGGLPATAQQLLGAPTTLPSAQTQHQSAIIAGKRLNYLVTVGSIALKDAAGNVTGEVAYTAYTVPGESPTSRPVTFAINGGPGAASIALNFGALGPKQVARNRQDGSASAPPQLKDNINSWLDFTDLVFIDPIGTGYSRSRLDSATTRSSFLTSASDVAYLSDVVLRWLTRENRLLSPKYLLGESYAGYRVPRMAYQLQTRMGVGITGVVMVSPMLTLPLRNEEDTINPLSQAFYLPAMAATDLELKGMTPTPALMARVERYSRSDFVLDFLAGRADRAATERLTNAVAAFSGLDRDLVQRLDGRVDVATFLRERRRAEGKVLSFLDASVAAVDPFPASADANYDDPLMANDSPRVPAMIDFLAGTMGWRVDDRYVAVNREVNMQFDRDRTDSAVTELRKIMANDPALRVMIAHGYTDFACPYLASKVIIDQMPTKGIAERVRLDVYPGGHMFYDRPESAARWREDALRLYRGQ